MNNNQAREYFKNKGLNYSNIRKEHIEKLICLVYTELEKYLNNGTKYSKEMNMKVKQLGYRDKKFTKNGLHHAYIRVDGSYFGGRECISFNSDGFIGFCGWADSTNTEPIINAFVEWCDYIIDEVKKSN